MIKIMSTLRIENGVRVWRNDARERHRVDGPATECANGSKEWWVHGERHREDGPAVEWVDGSMF
jgi:hypothetical protein